MTTQNLRPRASAERLVSAVRDELRDRRAARAAARDLARDLAAYTTPRQIEDLLATVERYEREDVEQMRSILVANLHQARSGALAS